MIGNQTPSRDFTVYFTCIQSSTKIVLGFETIYMEFPTCCHSSHSGIFVNDIFTALFFIYIFIFFFFFGYTESGLQDLHLCLA